jgi:hypothetical protein
MPRQPRIVSNDGIYHVLNRGNSGLEFDQKIPNNQFQLGTTDLCLQSNSKGMRNYSIPCFAIHNSNRWDSLPISFWKSYLYIRRKWKSDLPIDLPYSTITRSCLPMIKTSEVHWF